MDSGEPKGMPRGAGGGKIKRSLRWGREARDIWSCPVEQVRGGDKEAAEPSTVVTASPALLAARPTSPSNALKRHRRHLNTRI